MEYSLSDELKNLMQIEIENHQNRKEIFGAISKQIFPDLKRSALLIGDHLDLVSYD